MRDKVGSAVMNGISFGLVLGIASPGAMPNLPKLQDGVLRYRGRSVFVEEVSERISYDQFQVFRGGTRMWLLTRAGVRLYSLPDLKLIAFHHGARDAFVKGEKLGIVMGEGDQFMIRWDNRKFRGRHIDFMRDVSSDGTLVLTSLNGASRIVEVGRDFRILKTWSNTPGDGVDGPVERLSRREFVCSSMGALDLYFQKYRLNPDGTTGQVELSKEPYYVPEGAWVPSWIGGALVCELNTRPGQGPGSAPHLVARYWDGKWHFWKRGPR